MLDSRPVVFGCGERFADSAQADPQRLGAKGAGLVRMAARGLPVPPGFVLSVGLCRAIGEGLSPNDVLREGLDEIARHTGRRFGSERPLLVSVRSGAAISMPGMMDTVLDVGATREAVALIAGEGEETSPRFAADCRARYLASYVTNVLHRPRAPFDEAMELPPEDRLERVESLADGVPDDAHAALHAAVRAVIGSWDGERARQYRTIAGIEGEGTAVVVQAMVFGNRDERSATGVARTRDPDTGSWRLHGDFLPLAQGEDVVDGTRNPLPLATPEGEETTFADWQPDTWRELERVARIVESHERDAQEIEFTVESGRLWLLQTRSMKRSVEEGVRIAVALAEEEVITRAEALERADPHRALAQLRPRLAPDQPLDVIARGVPASRGVAGGRVVMSAAEAVRARDERAGPTVLVRPETDPSDVAGIDAAAAVLTARGGRTSHAASVAASYAKPCVTGAMTLEIDADGFSSLGRRVERGDAITVDGGAGRVYAGLARTVPAPEPDRALQTLLAWSEGRAERGGAEPGGAERGGDA